MALSLLFVKRHIYLHIALLIVLLFSSQQGKTQSILLPGDVVVVSANASNDSFEFIPLMDIEKNTTIYFSNSLPDENGNHRYEIRILFKQDISAGTNFNIGLHEDARIEADGILKFSEKNHLFAYQREKEIER